MQIITKLINSTKTRNVPETFAITRNIWERVKYQVSSDSWTMLQNFYTFNTIRQIPCETWPVGFVSGDPKKAYAS